MEVNIGKYAKNKPIPKVYGPKRRVSRKALAKKAVAEHEKNRKGVRKKKFLLYLFVTLFFLGIAAAIWKFNSFTNRVRFTGDGSEAEVCNNIFNPQCWTDAFKPSLKQTDGFTNALLIGLDTRPVGEESALKNTDSIIILSINHKEKKAMLISIPRDMLADVQIDGKYCCSMKINSVYSLADARDDVDDGLVLLQENLERYLGIEIHYSGTINFEAVKDGVDAVGGVEVDIPVDIVADYPDDEPPYAHKNIEFKQGKQLLDGKKALVWGRFRYVARGPAEYASDFSRARRQQQVISALKEKALGEDSDIGAKAQKYWGIYQSISSNLKLNSVSFEDALAAISLITEDYNLDPLNVVLDPSFGGFNNLIITAPTDETFGYHIVAKDRTWNKIKEEIANIWEYPDIYSEEPIVTVVNRSGVGFATDSPAIKLQNTKIPFLALYMLSAAKTQDEGVTIIDFSGGTKPKTIEFFKQFFGTETVIADPATAGIQKSSYGEDIKIEIGLPVTSTTATPTE